MLNVSLLIFLKITDKFSVARRNLTQQNILGIPSFGSVRNLVSTGPVRDTAGESLNYGAEALYVDGTNFRIQRRGSTEKEPTLVVLGMDEYNSRSILAIEPGFKDNVESRRAVFSGLKKRGLKGSDVRLATETIKRQFKRRTKTMDAMGEITLESVFSFVALKDRDFAAKSSD